MTKTKGNTRKSAKRTGKSSISSRNCGENEGRQSQQSNSRRTQIVKTKEKKAQAIIMKQSLNTQRIIQTANQQKLRKLQKNSQKGQASIFKRPKVDENHGSDIPSFWKDVQNQYFKHVEPQELQLAVKSSRQQQEIKEQQPQNVSSLQSGRNTLFKEVLKTRQQEETQSLTYKESNQEEDFSLNFIQRSQIPTLFKPLSQRSKRQGGQPRKDYFSQFYIKHGKGQQVQRDEQLQKYGPLFSFFDYYQDFINDLGFLADSNDQEELDHLRKNQAIDPHVEITNQEIEDQTKLFGYTLMPCKVIDDYSADYFINHLIRSQTLKEKQYSQQTVKDKENIPITIQTHQQPLAIVGSSLKIDDEIRWLEQELEIAQSQTKRRLGDLETNIYQVQKQEQQLAQLLKESNSKLQKQFVETLILQEAKQFADSIMRIKAKKLMPSTYNEHKDSSKLPYLFRKKRFRPKDLSSRRRQYEFLIEVDPSLGIPPQWITERELGCLNILREEINSVSLFRSQGALARVQEQKQRENPGKIQRRTEKKVPIIEKELFRSQELMESADHGFCHHCKQLKTTYIMAHCKYNSQIHGMLMPVSQSMSGISLYNVDPRQTPLINHLILKKVFKDKKKRSFQAQDIELTCQKQFCSFCLKNYYDVIIQEAQCNPNWICPFCTGQCFCSRCMRQDQMTKIRAYLIATSQDEIHSTMNERSPSDVVLSLLGKSSILLDNLIRSNFNRVVRIARQAKSNFNSNDSFKNEKQSINDEKEKPLFMTTFNLNEPNDYLFPEIDQTICDPQVQISPYLQRGLVDFYAEFVRQETERVNAQEIEYFNLINRIDPQPMIEVQIEETKLEEIYEGSDKKRTRKQQQKEVQILERLTAQSLNQLESSQNLDENVKKFIQQDINEEAQSPIELQDIKLVFPPLLAGSTITTSKASSNSMEHQKKSSDEDLVIQLKSIHCQSPIQPISPLNHHQSPHKSKSSPHLYSSIYSSSPLKKMSSSEKVVTSPRRPTKITHSSPEIARGLSSKKQSGYEVVGSPQWNISHSGQRKKTNGQKFDSPIRQCEYRNQHIQTQ